MHLPTGTTELPVRMKLPSRSAHGAALPFTLEVTGEGTAHRLDGQVRQLPKRRLRPILALLVAALLVGFLVVRPEDSTAITAGTPDEAVGAHAVAVPAAATAGSQPVGVTPPVGAPAPAAPAAADAGGEQAAPSAAPRPEAPAGDPTAVAPSGPDPGTSGTSTTARAGFLSVAGTLDLGTVDGGTKFGTVALRNTGAQPIDFTSQPGAGLTAAPSKGSIRPGQIVNVTVTLNPAGLPEGPRSVPVGFNGSGGSQTTQVKATIRRQPTIQGEYESGNPCTGPWELRAGTSDESEVTLTVQGTAGSNPFSGSLTHLSFGFWETTIHTSAGTSPAAVSYTLTATDRWGAQASKSRTFSC